MSDAAARMNAEDARRERSQASRYLKELNSLKDEIARLRKECKNHKKVADSLENAFNEQGYELERVSKENERLYSVLKTAVIETVVRDEFTIEDAEAP